jgi:hypothetical protein
MRTKLADAATAYREAPGNLQEAILEAAASGDTAPDIFRAIGDGAYSLDYVRQLIGEARKAGKIPPRVTKPKS